MSSSIFKSYPKMSYFSGRSKRNDSEIQARDMPKTFGKPDEKNISLFSRFVLQKERKTAQGFTAATDFCNLAPCT